MFASGTDTIYTTLEWAMAELLRHLSAMKELYNEVREITKSQLNISENDRENALLERDNQRDSPTTSSYSFTFSTRLVCLFY